MFNTLIITTKEIHTYINVKNTKEYSNIVKITYIAILNVLLFKLQEVKC
jgi:hypothetical protein